MRIVTFRQPGSESAGEAQYRIGALVAEREIADLTPLVSSGPLTSSGILGCLDLGRGFLDQAREELRKESAETVSMAEVEICSPVPRPGKIICIGLNYRDHAEESGMAIPTAPVIFSKYSSCAIASGETIVVPAGSTQTDYEAELAFIIGRRAKDVRRDDALRYVFGYANLNDVSARDFQFADAQWHRGKSCDTFAPMGPYIATADEIPDPQALRIQFRLNGETMQDSSTEQMIFGVAELIEYLSRYNTLEPGDVVATGTPPGVGFARKPPVYLAAGDVAEVEIDGLGVLSNPVAAA
jgi:2-keto-4-pentenoate hydratase/2-oxohepta-3-ene-1,7-dioic acid hydratase in catechol pathway